MSGWPLAGSVFVSRFEVLDTLEQTKELQMVEFNARRGIALPVGGETGAFNVGGRVKAR